MLHYTFREELCYVQATNFERHNQSIDVMDIVSSIRYIKETPYFGFTRGLHPASMTFRTMLRTPSTDGVPKLCFHCGKDETTSKRCSRCKVVVYCSAECQKKDWKRHKKGECLPRVENAGGESST